MATGVSTTKWNGERQSIESTAADADLSVTLSYAGKKSAEEILTGPCPFQFLVASDKLDQAKASFKVKMPPEAKHSTLSDFAKRAVDPAIKAASLAMLAKAGGVI